MIRLLSVVLLCVAFFATPLFSQQTSSPSVVVLSADGGPDYEAFDRLSKRAEDVIAADRASDDALGVLREQLVEWRTAFEDRQSVNGVRIKVLGDQIAALGAVPEDGSQEPADITQRREELTAELAAARQPVRRAEEAFAEADGIVDELDRLLRARQLDARLALGPSPLNPSTWSDATSGLAALRDRVVQESQELSASLSVQSSRQASLPRLVVMTLFGLLLMLRSSRWVGQLIDWSFPAHGHFSARRRVLSFVASFGRLVLPILGVLLIWRAVNLAQILGHAGTLVAEAIATVLVIGYVGRWLAIQAFPQSDPKASIIALPEGRGSTARLLISLTAILIGISEAVSWLMADRIVAANLGSSAQPILLFPVIILGGIVLFQLGRTIAGAAAISPTGSDEEQDAGPKRLILSFLSRATLVVAIGGPILAAIGYVFAGKELVFASAMTLGLLAFIAVLQRLIRDIAAWFSGEDGSSTGLLAAAINVLIAIGALPVLALIWGARWADLSELFASMADGISFGDFTISPVSFLVFALVFVVGYALTRLLQATLRTQILPRTRLDKGGQNAVISGVGYLGIFLAAVIGITSAGINLSSLAIVAGALSVGIGFGLQTIVSNFVSGIILLVERPVAEGDWIEVGDTMGTVKAISVRSTTISTFDRTEVIIPNTDLIAGKVTNWTKGNLTGRLILPVGVAYGTDIDKVTEILQEIAEAHPLVILNPPPMVVMQGFGASELMFELRAILRDVNYILNVKDEMNRSIAKRFAEEGIEIPFAQRDLWLRNPEALKESK